MIIVLCFRFEWNLVGRVVTDALCSCCPLTTPSTWFSSPRT